MRTIYKYMLTDQITEVQIPVTGKVVHVGLDPAGIPCVWIELDAINFKAARLFTLVGTGQTVPDFGEHRGTFVQGAFVWHVYEVRK